MTKLLILVSTSLTVSLDSFAAGFSLSLSKKKNTVLPAAVALVTLALCALSTFVGQALKGYLSRYVNVLGAIILAALAFANLLKKDEQSSNLRQTTVAESLLTGVAVGTDACIANLSLAVDGYGFAAPIVFAVTHYFTVFAGQKLADKISLPNANIISAIVLLALAIYKLFS